NDSGVLGKYICHHNYRTGASGRLDGFEDKYFYGKNPTECILVNFRNLGKQDADADFVGGYTTFTGGYRERGEPTQVERIGGVYKESLTKPGPWGVYMYMQGETIPRETNTVSLHPTQKDQWGIPLLTMSVGEDDQRLAEAGEGHVRRCRLPRRRGARHRLGARTRHPRDGRRAHGK